MMKSVKFDKSLDLRYDLNAFCIKAFKNMSQETLGLEPQFEQVRSGVRQKIDATGRFQTEEAEAVIEDLEAQFGFLDIDVKKWYPKILGRFDEILTSSLQTLDSSQEEFKAQDEIEQTKAAIVGRESVDTREVTVQAFASFVFDEILERIPELQKEVEAKERERQNEIKKDGPKTVRSQSPSEELTRAQERLRSIIDAEKRAGKVARDFHESKQPPDKEKQ